MAEPITLTEASKLFGFHKELLKLYVKEGMPVVKRERPEGQRGGLPAIYVDPEVTRVWLAEHGKKGYRKTLLKHASEQAEVVAAVAPRPGQIQIDKSAGLEGAISRLRAAEMVAFQAYVQARNSGNMQLESARLELYVDTCRALKSLEAISDERTKMEQDVWEKTNWHVTSWAETIAALIDEMPRALAPKVNPADPQLAETTLRDWVQSQLKPLMARPLKGQ